MTINQAIESVTYLRCANKLPSIKNLIHFSVILLTVSLISCKDEIAEDVPAELSEEKKYHDEIFNKNVSYDFISFIENNDEINETEFDAFLKEVDESTNNPVNRSLNTWGITFNNQVWKWNGSTWFMPNPAATLKFVDVSAYGSNGSGFGVWGIGVDDSVWKWNGSTWFEPNSAASLHYISSYSDQAAIGIGWQGQVVVTNDGGLSWSNYTAMTNIWHLSVGNSVTNPIWAIQTINGVNPTLWKYQLYRGWKLKRTPTAPKFVAAMFSNGAVFTENVSGSARIFRTDDEVTFFMPNPAAAMYRSPSIAGNDIFWGIGWSDTPILSENGGYTWSTPNAAANLAHIDVGYE